MKNFLIVLFYILFFCVFCIYTEKSKGKVNEKIVPKFDADKTFSAVQCNKTHCFCVEKNGIQIGNYHGLISSMNDMNCKCARDKKEYADTKLVGKLIWCTSNGNYENIQCRGSVCYCVDWNGRRNSRIQVSIGKIATLRCPENTKRP